MNCIFSFVTEKKMDRNSIERSSISITADISRIDRDPRDRYNDLKELMPKNSPVWWACSFVEIVGEEEKIWEIDDIFYPARKSECIRSFSSKFQSIQNPCFLKCLFCNEGTPFKTKFHQSSPSSPEMRSHLLQAHPELGIQPGQQHQKGTQNSRKTRMK